MNLRCPKCGAGQEDIRVEATAVCEVIEGAFVPTGDFDVHPGMPTYCVDCEHEGEIRDFRIEEDSK